MGRIFFSNLGFEQLFSLSSDLQLGGPNFAGGPSPFGVGGKTDPIDHASTLFIKQKKDMVDACCPNLNPKYYVVSNRALSDTRCSA